MLEVGRGVGLPKQRVLAGSGAEKTVLEKQRGIKKPAFLIPLFYKLWKLLKSAAVFGADFFCLGGYINDALEDGKRSKRDIGG